MSLVHTLHKVEIILEICALNCIRLNINDGFLYTNICTTHTEMKCFVIISGIIACLYMKYYTGVIYGFGMMTYCCIINYITIRGLYILDIIMISVGIRPITGIIVDSVKGLLNIGIMTCVLRLLRK